MRFSKGYYIHENFMDIAIEVIKVSYQDSKQLKLKVFWWNRGWTGNPWLIPVEQLDTLIIKDENLKYWKKIETLNRYMADK